MKLFESFTYLDAADQICISRTSYMSLSAQNSFVLVLETQLIFYKTINGIMVYNSLCFDIYDSGSSAADYESFGGGGYLDDDDVIAREIFQWLQAVIERSTSRQNSINVYREICRGKYYNYSINGIVALKIYHFLFLCDYSLLIVHHTINTVTFDSGREPVCMVPCVCRPVYPLAI